MSRRLSGPNQREAELMPQGDAVSSIGNSWCWKVDMAEAAEQLGFSRRFESRARKISPPISGILADIGPYFTVDIGTFAWYKAGIRGGVK
jgi:hypothetical protein